MNHTLGHADRTLCAALRKLVTQGGVGNQLFLLVGSASLLYRANRGELRVRCETVPDPSRTPGIPWSDEQRERLSALGFEGPDEPFDYHCTVLLGSPAQESGKSRPRKAPRQSELRKLAAHSIRIFQEIFGCTPNDFLELRLELKDSQHPENPELSAAMDVLAEQESDQAWKDLFFALLKARFLVPTEPGQARRRKSVLTARNHRGERLLPVFTDYTAVRKFEPDGLPYFVMTGIEFFPWAVAHRLMSVVINPAGPVCGKLGPGQIETLATAASAQS